MKVRSEDMSIKEHNMALDTLRKSGIKIQGGVIYVPSEQQPQHIIDACNVLIDTGLFNFIRN